MPQIELRKIRLFKWQWIARPEDGSLLSGNARTKFGAKRKAQGAKVKRNTKLRF
jgi:hypothetical protein